MEKLATYVVREGALSARDAVGWIYRLAVTLTPIHGLGVAHGRVSAKAILIEAPDCGSEAYLLDAGDLLDDPAHFSLPRCEGGPRCPADDTWAAGVILYRMLTGQLPFPGVSAAAVGDRINRAPAAPLAVFDTGDDELQMILDRLFARDVYARLTDLAELGRLLLGWDPSLGGLTALHFGKPDEDEDDDDGETEMTQVYQVQDAAAPKPYRLVTGSRAPWDPPAPRPVARQSVEVVVDDEPPADDVLIDERAGLELLDHRSGARAAPAAPPDRSEPSIAILLDADDTGERAVAPPPPGEPAAQLGGAEAREPGAAAPVGGRRRGPRTLLWFAAAAAVLAVAAAIRFGGVWPRGASPGTAPSVATTSRPQEPAERTDTPASRASAPASSVASVPSVAPVARVAPAASVAPAAPSAASGAPAAGATPEEISACVLPLFAAETFAGKEPKLAFVCKETDAHKGSIRMRTEVVRAARGVNEGMREWANLGWYGMAVFGIARARCCADPPPLSTRSRLPQCELDARIEALGQAAVSGDDARIEAAYDGFHKAIQCLALGGDAAAFGEEGMPRGGARTVFERSLARARKLAAAAP